jgi:exopolysaccharide biosynthesis polyprenyl glycosylphosphotransferase
VSTFVAAEQLFEALDERTLELLARRRMTGAIRRRGWLVRRALLVADVVGLTLAFVLAESTYPRHFYAPGTLSQFNEYLAFALSLPAWVVAAKIYGLYDKDEERTDHSTTDEFAKIFHLLTVCTFLLYAVSLLVDWFDPEFSKLLLFWLLGIASTLAARSVARTYCRRHISYLQNTIIVGAGDAGQALARKLLNHSEYGLNLVGFVDSNPKERGPGLAHLTVLGDLNDLVTVVELLDVERVVVAFTSDPHEELLSSIRNLREKDVQIDIVPRLFDNLGPSISIHAIEGIPLVSLPPTKLPSSSMFIKRSLDIAVSAALLVVLSPLLATVAVVVALSSAGPVFYRHTRVGRGGKPLRLLKFRTMYIEACRGDDYGGELAEDEFARLMTDSVMRDEFERTFKLQHDPRVTQVGKFLRRTSLDELPQLWNVLRGDISLVGPRALTAEELERYYGSAAASILVLRPGVTGYWQVNGRSNLQYEDRVRLDLAYIGGWSLALDLTILARTLRVVFAQKSAV